MELAIEIWHWVSALGFIGLFILSIGLNADVDRVLKSQDEYRNAYYALRIAGKRWIDAVDASMASDKPFAKEWDKEQAAYDNLRLILTDKAAEIEHRERVIREFIEAEQREIDDEKFEYRRDR